MAEAEAGSIFLPHTGPKPGVSYPLDVVYCPPESKKSLMSGLFSGTTGPDHCAKLVTAGLGRFGK